MTVPVVKVVNNFFVYFFKGIGMALFSYADRLRVTIVADEACLSEKEDVELLRDEFENQLAEMAERTGIAENVFVEN